jgi:hypothetical protein
MRSKDIVCGCWYQTTHGFGPVNSVSGSGARSRVEIDIRGPMPFGRRYIRPADVQEKIDPPKRFVSGAAGESG